MERSGHKAARSFWRVWLVPVLLAFSTALLIRTFCFEAFRIPTPSMEKNLLVGDLVLVSKLHYGPRTPATLGVPFTQVHTRRPVLPVFRLPGFSRVRRGDVIVFNFPPEPGAVDRKTHFIKRVVGLPGDSVAVVRKQLYVNGEPQALREGMQQKWVARLLPGSKFRADRLAAYDVSQVAHPDPRHVTFEGTEAMARTVASWEGVKSVEPLVHAFDPSFGLRVFPEGRGYGRDHYGPVYVPARGDTLTLTRETWPLYAELVTRFEGHAAGVLPDGSFTVDGRPATQYVVEQDYFFVMGDNRDSSSDSRVWGFVPMDHVVGKAVLIYFSWDEASGRPRPDRILRPVR